MPTVDISPEYRAYCTWCAEELVFEDALECRNCKLTFDTEHSSRAEFADPEEPACGAPYPYPTPVRDRWHDRRGVERRYVRHDYPCDLPASHDLSASDHHYPSLSIHCREE